LYNPALLDLRLPRLDRLVLAIGLFVATGCVTRDAPPVTPEPVIAGAESVVPGTIGIVVKAGPAGVVVTAVGKDSPAAAAGLRVGDVLLRYNGVSVADSRQFYTLMLDSAPGSTVQVELLREGRMHRVDVPVEQIDTTLRV
jgi:S1-C subfamily serine protease